MTGRHTRHIVLVVLALALVSAPIFAQEESGSQDVAGVREKAEQGDVNAQFFLGDLYAGEMGFLGVRQDEAEAARWYRMAAEQGHAQAQYNISGFVEYGFGGLTPDLVEAVKWARLAAEQGHADGQKRLGWYYQMGRGVPEDYAEAVRWYRLAAEQGHADAQSALGSIYSSRLNQAGVDRDDAEATRWYRLAAEQGDVEGQYNLGNMYAAGRGVAQDDTEALRWFRLAAELGEYDVDWPINSDERALWFDRNTTAGRSQYRIGLMYEQGRGVGQDDAEAIRWFRKAAEAGESQAEYQLVQMAEQGNVDAQTALGVMYAKPRGFRFREEKYRTESARWLVLAAEQGGAVAQFNLGLAYATGEGVPQDVVEYVKWIQLAAEQGHGPAQARLGSAYSTGEGVLQDDAEAVRWYRLAAEQGVAEAQYQLAYMYYRGASEVGFPPRDTNNSGSNADERKLFDSEMDRLFLLAAEGGHLDAQIWLADKNWLNASASEPWLRMAAEQGHAPSQYLLGLYFLEGYQEIQIDEIEALRWLGMAATQGHSEAKSTLAGALGLPPPSSLVSSAETGDLQAQRALAKYYRLRSNGAEARRWELMAAEQGDVEAMSTVASLYLSGRGVPEDKAESLRWFRLINDKYTEALNEAKEGGDASEIQLAESSLRDSWISLTDMWRMGMLPLPEDAEGRYQLGSAYERPDSRQDYTETARWHRLAADQGHARAQFNLGMLYVDGEGVPQDDVLAHVWLNLAGSRAGRNVRVTLVGGGESSLRDSAIRNRDITARRMTPGQLADAQRLAREWTPVDRPRNSLLGATGTAFIVNPAGALLTAHHVIDGATSITVSCNGQPAVPATVESSSPAIDLAVLKASRGLGTQTFLRLSPDRVPSLGDTVFTMGYPTPALLGVDVKYTDGTVSALSGPGGDASFLQISVPIQPGNSGGPLVNEAGDVIGVVVATADAPTFFRAADAMPQNINWAVKSVFASALFTSPTASAPSGGGDVIDRVTEATCLVRATVTAQ